MCYYLYGAINKEVNKEELQVLNEKSEYRFKPGTKHDVKMCCVNDTPDFLLTDWMCCCDFPIGDDNPAAHDLVNFENAILKLKEIENAQCVYFSKTWNGTRNKKEVVIKLSEINLREYLSKGEENCLYKLIF